MSLRIPLCLAQNGRWLQNHTVIESCPDNAMCCPLFFLPASTKKCCDHVRKHKPLLKAAGTWVIYEVSCLLKIWSVLSTHAVLAAYLTFCVHNLSPDLQSKDCKALAKTGNKQPSVSTHSRMRNCRSEFQEVRFDIRKCFLNTRLVKGWNREVRSLHYKSFLKYGLVKCLSEMV